MNKRTNNWEEGAVHNLLGTRNGVDAWSACNVSSKYVTCTIIFDMYKYLVRLSRLMLPCCVGFIGTYYLYARYTYVQCARM